MKSLAETKPRSKKHKKMIKRPFWMWLHTVISSFYLSAALIFLITGALLPFHIRGSSESQTHEIIFDEPVDTTDTDMLNALTSELDKRSILHTWGTIKTGKESITWLDTNKLARLKITDAGFGGQLKITQYSFYQRLIRFHFALSPPVKIFAVSLTIAASLIFITGIVLALQVPSLRKTTIIWTAIGFVFTTLLFLLA
ncbi:hypothetical protein JD969_15535 [Planctomycetota bacterium]|nr:hypothetical protein JD969_15535 [Planctomycetota bacterium]